jgi:hypothetical protein
VTKRWHDPDEAQREAHRIAGATAAFFLSPDRETVDAFVCFPFTGGVFRGGKVGVELDERTRETVRQALLAVLDAAHEQERERR